MLGLASHSSAPAPSIKAWARHLKQEASLVLTFCTVRGDQRGKNYTFIWMCEKWRRNRNYSPQVVTTTASLGSVTTHAYYFGNSCFNCPFSGKSWGDSGIWTCLCGAPLCDESTLPEILPLPGPQCCLLLSPSFLICLV